jgi:hypothetical protein
MRRHLRENRRSRLPPRSFISRGAGSRRFAKTEARGVSVITPSNPPSGSLSVATHHLHPRVGGVSPGRRFRLATLTELGVVVKDALELKRLNVIWVGRRNGWCGHHWQDDLRRAVTRALLLCVIDANIGRGVRQVRRSLC